MTTPSEKKPRKRRGRRGGGPGRPKGSHWYATNDGSVSDSPAARLRAERDATMRERGFVLVEEAMRLTGRSKIQIHRWRYAGQLRTEKDGRFCYVSVEDLKQLSAVAAAALAS